VKSGSVSASMLNARIYAGREKNKIKKMENKIKRTEPCSMRVFVQVERATKKIEHRGTL